MCVRTRISLPQESRDDVPPNLNRPLYLPPSSHPWTAPAPLSGFRPPVPRQPVQQATNQHVYDAQVSAREPPGRNPQGEAAGVAV